MINMFEFSNTVLPLEYSLTINKRICLFAFQILFSTRASIDK